VRDSAGERREIGSRAERRLARVCFPCRAARARAVAEQAGLGAAQAGQQGQGVEAGPIYAFGLWMGLFTSIFGAPNNWAVDKNGKFTATFETDQYKAATAYVKDLYSAENQLVKALPKMAKAAHSPKLKAAFEKHMGETDGHVERLEQVFASIGETPKGKTCDAILGIIEEGKEVMDEYKGMPALDAGLLAAAQAVEHYEISRYGTLKTWANELGYNDAVKLLDATLKEEKTPTAR